MGLLHEALDAVEVERRAVMLLHDVDGETAPHIAEAIGIPLNTVPTRACGLHARSSPPPCEAPHRPGCTVTDSARRRSASTSGAPRRDPRRGSRP